MTLVERPCYIGGDGDIYAVVTPSSNGDSVVFVTGFGEERNPLPA
ncbi:MAG: hypothetical protein U5N86_11595 [Planctomycetota bacterium]|nr:hypothetical protein [Planctomycetota bacterium]